MRITLTICLALAITGCTQLPDVDAMLGPPPPGDSYPSLLPTAELRALDTETDVEKADADAALLARAQALRTRASALGSGDGN